MDGNIASQGNMNIFWVLTHISVPSPCHSDSSRADCGHQIGCTQLVLTADKGQLKSAGCFHRPCPGRYQEAFFFRNRFHFALIMVNLTDAVRLKDFKGAENALLAGELSCNDSSSVCCDQYLSKP